MKTLLMIAVLASLVPSAYASDMRLSAESYQSHTARRDLTPRERVEINARSSYYSSEEYARLTTRYDTGIADKSLVDRVLAQLKSDPELADRVMRLKVSAENSTLRLEGIVNDEAERNLVAEKAAQVEGVRAVKNALRVKRSDRDLLESEI